MPDQWTERFYWAMLMVYLLLIISPESTYSALTDVKCEEIYGYLGKVATLRCSYKPKGTTLAGTEWYKDSKLVYTYVPNNPIFTGPDGEFVNRSVHTETNVTSGYHDMHIDLTIIKDEDVYKCDITPTGGVLVPAICPKLTLRVPPSRFELWYVQNGTSTSVPEGNTWCNDSHITVEANNTVSLKYITASRPRSTIISNYSMENEKTENKILNDNTIQTTFTGDITLKADETETVKFTISSSNPDFTAGLLVEEACITLYRQQGRDDEKRWSWWCVIDHRHGEAICIVLVCCGCYCCFHCCGATVVCCYLVWCKIKNKNALKCKPKKGQKSQDKASKDKTQSGHNAEKSGSEDKKNKAKSADKTESVPDGDKSTYEDVELDATSHPHAESSVIKPPHGTSENTV